MHWPTTSRAAGAELLEGRPRCRGAAGQGRRRQLPHRCLLPEPRSSAGAARGQLGGAGVRRAGRQAQTAMNAVGMQGNIHVVYLRNADATRLATTLRGACRRQRLELGWRRHGRTGRHGCRRHDPPGCDSRRDWRQRQQRAAVIHCSPRSAARSRPIRATNALIISAPEPQRVPPAARGHRPASTRAGPRSTSRA